MVGVGHDIVPESASLHVKVTVTSVLFHPFAFAAGARVATIEGEDLSMFTVAVAVDVLPALSTTVPVTD